VGSYIDCIKYGLDYVYVILNATTGRQIYLTNGALWTDSILQENVAGFLSTTAILEKIIK
jgi:hypothetical protein